MSIEFGYRCIEEFEPDFSEEEDDRELTQRSDAATSPRGTASKSETSELQANLERPSAENSSETNKVPPATGLHRMSCCDRFPSFNAFVAAAAPAKPGLPASTPQSF